MSTKIEWTDETWNPTTGCTKVSPGCDNCYAKTMHERFHGRDSFETVTLHPERLNLPLRWRKPRKVFVNSMSDLFHQDIPDEYIAQVFAAMALAPQHTFQVLTKRHSRMRSLLDSIRFRARVDTRAYEWAQRDPRAHAAREALRLPDGSIPPRWPLPNVWLGVSVEDQKWADIRIPALLDTPTTVRFLSCEPLLGPIDLLQSINQEPLAAYHFKPGGIDWVIAGGESGHGARPMHPDWVRSLRDQCTAAGVAFLFKQWGAWAPTTWVGAGLDPSGRRVYVPDSTVTPGHGYHPIEGRELQRVGKGKAGRELDGRTWDEFPQAVTA